VEPELPVLPDPTAVPLGSPGSSGTEVGSGAGSVEVGSGEAVGTFALKSE